jgi:hypothetical protein
MNVLGHGVPMLLSSGANTKLFTSGPDTEKTKWRLRVSTSQTTTKHSERIVRQRFEITLSLCTVVVWIVDIDNLSFVFQRRVDNGVVAVLSPSWMHRQTKLPG